LNALTSMLFPMFEVKFVQFFNFYFKAFHSLFFFRTSCLFECGICLDGHRSFEVMFWVPQINWRFCFYYLDASIGWSMQQLLGFEVYLLGITIQKNFLESRSECLTFLLFSLGFVNFILACTQVSSFISTKMLYSILAFGMFEVCA
jgi:hypothetical protein